jgi:hypothetical protein
MLITVSLASAKMASVTGSPLEFWDEKGGKTSAASEIPAKITTDSANPHKISFDDFFSVKNDTDNNSFQNRLHSAVGGQVHYRTSFMGVKTRFFLKIALKMRILGITDGVL